MNIKPVETTCSKAEELQTLEKITKVFPAGTYLADFFTPRLFAWIDGQIQNDCPPDIFDVIDWQAGESSKDQTARIKAEADLYHARKTHQRETQEMTDKIQDLEKRLQEMTNWKNALIESFDIEYRRRVENENDAMRAHAELGTLRREMTALKARLFDLMTNPAQDTPEPTQDPEPAQDPDEVPGTRYHHKD